MAASAVFGERTGSLKRSKFPEGQIVNAFRQADSGTPVDDLCQQLGIAEQTLYAWKKYAHLGASELRRLRQMEEEHARLKRLVADLSIDKRMLLEALRKKFKAHPPPGTGPVVSRDFSGDLCAGLLLGAVWSSLLVSAHPRKRSVGAAAAYSRSGSCAASVWRHAHLGIATT